MLKSSKVEKVMQIEMEQNTVVMLYYLLFLYGSEVKMK